MRTAVYAVLLLVGRRVCACALAVSLAAAAIAPAPRAQHGFPPAAEFSDRFEGLVPRQVANADFELLSFLGGRERLTSPGDLKIDFYLPHSRPAVVYAQELRDDKFYRMMTKPREWTAGAWNTYGPWPTSAVVSPGNVSLDNIGIVVSLGGAPGLSGEIAPAFVYRETRPANVRYTLVFKLLRTTLQEVKYSVTGPRAADAIAGTLPGDFIRGTPIVIEFDARSLAPGLHTVKIDSIPLALGAKPIERTFTFFHAR